jgi:hypothetical protein
MPSMRTPATGRRKHAVLVPLLVLLALGVVGFATGAGADQVRGRASAGALFTGVRIGDFAGEYSAPGGISEVPNPTGGGEEVLRFDVSNRDVYPITPTENPRAELVSPNIVRPGMEVWLSTRFLVPTNYPTISSGGWVSLVSFYGPPYDSSSPWQLELAGNGLQWQRNATYGFDIPFKGPLVKGRWTTLLVHERFARRGFVEMWINGRPIEFFGGGGGYNPRRYAPTRRLRVATRDRSNDGGRNSARLMQYRKAGMFSEGTIYFGALAVGRTRASVEP